ncbi:unnamed protein product [Rhizoctonia solani]|uniref:ubiquitinyl hydrolase 1 n=1 Tax=Rhizoctonia solani TaxID=456999 RepID=A0A8H2WCH6_9AGAM|nr:unnamed protein product [Rhizoctonia solani]
MATPLDPYILRHLSYHVFMPPKLPQKEQAEELQQSVDLGIIQSVIESSQQFGTKIEASSQWILIKRMLQRLYKYIEAPLEAARLAKDLTSMKPGDISCLHVKAQNAGLIIRKQADHTTFEVFEVQAQTKDVMSTPGRIIRKFPGPTVQLPNTVANDKDFINEVANILEQMNIEIFDEAQPKTRKAGTDVHESRDSINPNYFIQYFFGFLRGLGACIDPSRVVKRLGDEVLWLDAKNPWRRSPIWLLVRVALQTSLDSNKAYKEFMVYYHTFILSECCRCGSLSSDLLHAMCIKMARRLYKAKDFTSPFIIKFAEAVANRTRSLLQSRWDAIQSSQAPPRGPYISGSGDGSGTSHTLPHSRNYLQRVFQGRSNHIIPSKFVPDHSHRLEDIADFSQYANGALTRAFERDPHLALFDFEASIFSNLTKWSSQQLDYSKACVTLSSCFRQYLQLAKSYYAADVADRSIMILTVMRIWMAIDELATEDCPLLWEFSPEVPIDIMDTLLLRTAQHIDQAGIIQQYIRERYDGASSSNPSIFSDRATNQCFAIRYFNSSSRHQNLKKIIEANAEELKNRKIKELKEVNSKYEQLNGEVLAMAHDYKYKIDGKRKHINKKCGRCRKEKERDGLSIRPFEWPLPREQPNANAVVFELERPESFVIWRDITYEILVDLGTPYPRGRCNQHAVLEGYTPLSAWMSTPNTTTSRITVGSATKSFNQSHYSSTISVPALEDQVCLDNALEFRLYDRNGDAWAAGPFPSVTFSLYGTLKIPGDSPYRHLEYTIKGTTHSSNQVIADQHDCPKTLGLHEHIAFGTLRSGARLQWMNIVRGLEETLLTFSADEVRSLHAQAAWQIGPMLEDGTREWHEELRYSDFGHLLVSQSKRMLDRVKANWLQANSVSTLVIIITRLLESSPTEDVAKVACKFLREARAVTHFWLEQLRAKLQSATDENDIVDYQSRVCEMAAICRSTYDVDPRHMDDVLSTPDDFIPLVTSSVCLYDHQPPDIKSAPVHLQIILCRDRRFAHKVVPYMLSSIRDNDVLSKPLSKIWADYRPGLGGLEVYRAPDSRWIATTTANDKHRRKQEVHLNLLTGQLLIDGKPLGRLPRQYVEHETYVRKYWKWFPPDLQEWSLQLEIVSITIKWISFALDKNDKNLIVQAQKDDQLYELIPHETLVGDFPLFFSEDYHHWANINKKTVEFRPIFSPWSPEKHQWLLRFDNPRAATLANPIKRSLLIDIHSVLFKSLSLSVSPLESDRYIHVTRSFEDCIEVELPRMKLSFFINKDKQLESRNFRGQVLDENQSAGTLIGLRNQLLLRAKGVLDQNLPQSRSVLIADGEIEFSTHEHHVSVSIRLDSQRNVDVYRYKVDRDLNHLATDSGLTSRLFKIYLHALTSHCLPDPLTGRTGTEEALHELSQASTCSFEQITLKQAGLLKNIGQLTPKRGYYPEHRQCMQSTHWKNLSPLSQHFGFSFMASAILERAKTLHLFYQIDFQIDEHITALQTSNTLQKRAARRSVVYYPFDTNSIILQTLGFGEISDSVNLGRDDMSGDWTEAGQAASWATKLTHQNWAKPIFKNYNLVSLAESWHIMNDSEQFVSLSYQSLWINLDLGSSWITFYNLLRQARASSNRYMLSACLASIAFGQKLPMELIAVFLAFSTNPKFENLNPPSQKLFKFGDGYQPARKRVEEFVSAAAYPFESSPANELVQEEDEFYRDFQDRKKSYHTIHSSKYQSQLVQNLMDQWLYLNPRSSAAVQLSPPTPVCAKWVGPQTNTAQLADLFEELRRSKNPFNRRYSADLDESRKELDTKPKVLLPRTIPPLTILDEARTFRSSHLTERLRRLDSALSPQTDIEHIIASSGIWPRVTPRTILQQLSLHNRSRLDSIPKWRHEIILYARVFADYQRSQRLVALADAENMEDFYKELDTPSDRDPAMSDPDWLLVQIDGNFGARTVQSQVSQEMISPSSVSNIVLQLNMGEGKSSVIVPIIASSLADSTRLVRVVVLKPLWRQMFELLVNRLSGLSNRRIYYLPFGRHLQIDEANARKLYNLYEECMREGGILLAQPEHILSFKLMGIDRLISSNGTNNTRATKSLRDIQDWLTLHSRDILDESDEILHVRYQLVYTTGEQQPLEDHPNRWTTTQQLLRLASTHVEKLQMEYPDSVLFKSNSCGQFPALRIMPDCQAEAENKLVSAIARDILDGRLLNLNCDCLHPSVRGLLRGFFIDSEIPYRQYKLLKDDCGATTWKTALLVRGLLASGILVFALKRRHYRVDYGLDTTRSLLAVPYRAKDLPSLRAEFGHPDVAVVLTCLSYYYNGLSEKQLGLCFELLFKLDNPSLEYEQWVQRNDLTPDDLRQLNGVNIKDHQQFIERLVPAFSRNSATIDFFLSTIVFPKEAKEFPEKLATSGWDLASRKPHFTTGFSGTNDNRYLLPTSIIQVDPVKQLSTNALVLTYLLRPENNHYICMRGENGASLTTEGFLKLLIAQTPEVRVLLDVGAQMLELQNEELVRCWLGMRKDIEAAVYFNDSDELVVLPQNGAPTLLSTSPFAQLDTREERT